ncbi:hypothetical protein ACFFQF_24840 [Haladaptatus pallidirubidus]|uniref:Lipoprotein n=1 Tax=Haladaptatus pallidirubidus TaxID=1008152 RepID=A0AAV3UKT7_9EURY|nr:hypothetical protein [Haladaptatus pallidirubidus]
MKRTATIFVVFTVVLTGCAGFGSSAPNAEDVIAGDGVGGENDGANIAGDGGGDDEANGASNSEGETGENSFQPFRFDRPGTYTFDVMDAREGSGKLVWDIQAIDGENVTLNSIFEFGGEKHESSMTVNRDDAIIDLAFVPGGQYAVQTMYAGAMSNAYGKDLRVGQSWSFTTQDGTMAYEVTEKRTYAGIECYYSEVRIDGSVARVGCYSPDHGVAPYSAYYDENGETVLEVKLVEYEAK